MSMTKQARLYGQTTIQERKATFHRANLCGSKDAKIKKKKKKKEKRGSYANKNHEKPNANVLHRGITAETFSNFFSSDEVPASSLWKETRLVRNNTTCFRGVWLVNCSCCGLQASCGLVGSNEKPSSIVLI